MGVNEGSRAVTLIQPYLRGSQVVGTRIHVAASDVEAITPADARGLATALLEAAKDAERLDAAALPALDQFLAACDQFISPAARLGVADEALGLS